ncbi:MAG: isoprenylcysteine carboxyl methyltransferase family protein [Candidatus Binataceae bacterium]
MVITTNAYMGILVALAAERVFELVWSRRNARRLLSMSAVEIGNAHFPAMVMFHTAFIGAAAAEAVWLDRPFPGILGWAALCGAIAAQALRYWSVATLGIRWNTRIIVLPDVAPVTRGPYRFMRHPNYLAVVVELACIPLIHGCWMTAIVFSAGNAVLLRVRIRAEEKALGAVYARTLGAKPRFFRSPRGPSERSA